MRFGFVGPNRSRFFRAEVCSFAPGPTGGPRGFQDEPRWTRDKTGVTFVCDRRDWRAEGRAPVASARTQAERGARRRRKAPAEEPSNSFEIPKSERAFAASSVPDHAAKFSTLFLARGKNSPQRHGGAEKSSRAAEPKTIAECGLELDKAKARSRHFQKSVCDFWKSAGPTSSKVSRSGAARNISAN
jgi:hypothetical protein